MAGAGFASSPQPVSLSAQPDGAAAKPPSPSGGAKKKNKGVPAYMQPPFAKQITRTQAINGKLLEDNTMVRVLRGASSNDVIYDPKFAAQSHSRDLGAVRRFGDIIGRVSEGKVGTRAAAQGSFPSNWRPTAPPNDTMTRPASASSGVAVQRQITRKQDVNGKRLENIAMTRFLFGSAGNGQQVFSKQVGRMVRQPSLSRRGITAATPRWRGGVCRPVPASHQ